MKLHTSRAFRRRKVHRLKWRRRWKILVLDLLGRAESPERVAAAIGVGVAIGFSPFIGLHFVLALAVAFLFRLNKLDAVLGTLAGNVPTWSVVYPIGYRLGRAILHYDRHTVPKLNLERLFHSDITWIFHPIDTMHMVFGPRAFGPRFLSFVVGTSIVGILLGFAAAFVTLELLRLYHQRHPRVAIRAHRRRSGAHGKAHPHPHAGVSHGHSRPRPTASGEEPPAPSD